MHRLVVVSTVAVVTACAAGSGSDISRAPSPSASSRNVITRSEIERVGAKTVYEAVNRLRSQWLRPRTTGPKCDNPIQVYVDEVRAGGLEYLESRSVAGVTSIRFVSPADALMRWGPGHGSGVIQVRTGTTGTSRPSEHRLKAPA